MSKFTTLTYNSFLDFSSLYLSYLLFQYFSFITNILAANQAAAGDTHLPGLALWRTCWISTSAFTASKESNLLPGSALTLFISPNFIVNSLEMGRWSHEL